MILNKETFFASLMAMGLASAACSSDESAEEPMPEATAGAESMDMMEEPAAEEPAAEEPAAEEPAAEEPASLGPTPE